jgi:hypothetical protein
MKRVLIASILAMTIALSVVESASADVLVNYVPHHVASCMKVGVWYQSFSGGPRWAVIKVFHRASRSAIWIKHTEAVSSHWKFWTLCPAGGRYVVRYKTANGDVTFHVRVG